LLRIVRGLDLGLAPEGTRKSAPKSTKKERLRNKAPSCVLWLSVCCWSWVRVLGWMWIRRGLFQAILLLVDAANTHFRIGIIP